MLGSILSIFKKFPYAFNSIWSFPDKEQLTLKLVENTNFPLFPPVPFTSTVHTYLYEMIDPVNFKRSPKAKANKVKKKKTEANAFLLTKHWQRFQNNKVKRILQRNKDLLNHLELNIFAAAGPSPLPASEATLQKYKQSQFCLQQV